MSVSKRAYEYLMLMMYLIWSLVFFIDNEFLGNDLYRQFKHPPIIYSMVFFVLFLLAIYNLKAGYKHRFYAGFTTLLGSVAWFSLACLFAAAYPPLNPQALIYSWTALLSLCYGWSVIEKAKCERCAKR